MERNQVTHKYPYSLHLSCVMALFGHHIDKSVKIYRETVETKFRSQDTLSNGTTSRSGAQIAKNVKPKQTKTFAQFYFYIEL